MKLVEIAKVKIPESRVRSSGVKEEDIEARAASITDKGLIHAILLQDDGVTLIAGETRFKAVKLLHEREIAFRHDGELVPAGMVPFTVAGELTPVQVLEAELEENIERRDLDWQETADARAKLFKLRKARAEAEGREYVPATLAQELGNATSQINRSLNVARFLDHDSVKSAKTLRDAEKAVSKIVQSTLISALSDAVEEEADSLGTGHELIEGDSMVELPLLKSNTFDVVLTDPPYGIDIQNAGSMVETSHHYQDSPEYLDLILLSVPKELFRVMKSEGHLYWMCDFAKFSRISDALKAAGFDTYDRPIIWHKQGKSMAPDVTRWPKRTYECIIFAHKGNRPPRAVAGDVIITPYGSDLIQAEKPQELLRNLLSRSAYPGDMVLDPFAGSGSIFLAATAAECYAVGIELDPEKAKVAFIRSAGEAA